MSTHVKATFLVTVGWAMLCSGVVLAEPGEQPPGGLGQLTVGNSGLSILNWQINNATGVAGPIPDANDQVSGWTLVPVRKKQQGITTSTGNLTWAATSAPGSQLQLSMQTLLNPTTVGNDVQGAMANFDPNHTYSWETFSWQGIYSGPTDDALLTSTTAFDMQNFVNSFTGRFGWHLDLANSQIDLVYVPEPGTFALTALGLLAAWRCRRRAIAATPGL
jgi:hypothetical protein